MDTIPDLSATESTCLDDFVSKERSNSSVFDIDTLPASSALIDSFKILHPEFLLAFEVERSERYGNINARIDSKV